MSREDGELVPNELSSRSPKHPQDRDREHSNHCAYHRTADHVEVSAKVETRVVVLAAGLVAPVSRQRTDDSAEHDPDQNKA